MATGDRMRDSYDVMAHTITATVRSLAERLTPEGRAQAEGDLRALAVDDAESPYAREFYARTAAALHELAEDDVGDDAATAVRAAANRYGDQAVIDAVCLQWREVRLTRDRIEALERALMDVALTPDSGDGVRLAKAERALAASRGVDHAG